MARLGLAWLGLLTIDTNRASNREQMDRFQTLQHLIDNTLMKCGTMRKCIVYVLTSLRSILNYPKSVQKHAKIAFGIAKKFILPNVRSIP